MLPARSAPSNGSSTMAFSRAMLQTNLYETLSNHAFSSKWFRRLQKGCTSAYKGCNEQ